MLKVTIYLGQDLCFGNRWWSGRVKPETALSWNANRKTSWSINVGAALMSKMQIRRHSSKQLFRK